MFKNIAEPGRSQILTAWCMRIACWIRKSAYTNSEYVILTAFSLQKWLQERASLSYSLTYFLKFMPDDRFCMPQYAVHSLTASIVT